MILNKCRLCNSKILFKFLALGFHPPSDQFKKKVELNNSTVYYPLQVFSCSSCGFKQLNYVVEPKILYQQKLEQLIIWIIIIFGLRVLTFKERACLFL